MHSWFFRSPHWTDEYEYYIQIKKNPKLENELVTFNKLQELTADQLSARPEFSVAQNWSQDQPRWFVPKGLPSYRGFMYPGNTTSEFTLLVDRDSGDLFIYDRQF